MSLTSSISILAEDVEKQLVGLSESHRKILSIMKDMPSYFEDRNLADWESDYRAAIDVDEPENCHNWKAIDLIYDLAGFNLFSAFEIEETIKIYKKIVNELASLNIVVPKNLDVGKW